MVAFFIQFLSKVILKLEQWKYREWQGSIFSKSFIVKQTFVQPEFVTVFLHLVYITEINGLIKGIFDKFYSEWAKKLQTSRWSVLLQVPIHEKLLPIFVANKKHSSLSFTFFKTKTKKHRKKNVFFKIFKELLFLAGLNVNFCLFWEAKNAIIKNVVWLILSQ